MTVKDLEKYQDYIKAKKTAERKARIELRKLSSFIANCQDNVVRQIIISRYIDGLSWTATAIRAGGNNTPDTCRMMLKRYLTKLNKK